MTADFPPIGYASRPDAVRAAPRRGHAARLQPVEHPLADVVRRLARLGRRRPDAAARSITDGRYAERAAADLAAAGLAELVDVVVGTTRPQIRDHVVAVAGEGPVRAEADHLTHAQWLDLAGRAGAGARRRHDHRRCAGSRTAASWPAWTTPPSIADAALADGGADARPTRPTEADVRDELEYRMHRAGADGPSYDTIVASGPDNAARPHHHTGHRTIVEGDTVIIDVGALVDGYHSDMTRSFVVGEPSRRAGGDLRARARGPARRARRRARRRHRPVTSTRPAAACSPTAGYGDWYLHGTGHGVGLDIHEDPFASQASTAELLVGDVVTVEPGLYRGGFGGFRIEDLVEVTADGGRRLTHLSKDSPCLPSPPTT